MSFNTVRLLVRHAMTEPVHRARRVQRLFPLLLLCLVAAPVLAGGFYLPQQSARGTGMGESGLASLGELSLLHRNPASLSFLRGTMLSLGTTVVMPDTRFLPDGLPGVKMQSQVLFPPNVALSHTLGNGLAFGVSGSTPFSMKNEWDDGWIGSHQALRSEVRVVVLSPGVAFRLGSGASLGLALNFAFPHLQISRRVPAAFAGSPDPIASFDGTGTTGYGLTLGLLLRPTSNITLGLSYTSRMVLKTDDASVTYSGLPDSLLASYSPRRARTSMTTPDLVSAGLGGSLFPWLRVEADVSFAFWSTLKEIDITFKDASPALSSGGLQTIPYNWRNSWSLYSGLEIPMGDVDLRAGYVFEQSPVPDQYLTPQIPDANRRGFSAGIGYWVSEGVRLDFAYQFLQFDDRTVSPVVETQTPGQISGTYTTTWTVLGIGVSYFWK